jgi:hypothetical protein
MTPEVIGYCYHSVNVISFSLSLTDHIKASTVHKNSRRKQNNEINIGARIHVITIT